MIVIYDSNCGFCNKIAVNYLKGKDYNNQITWICRESTESLHHYTTYSINKKEESIILISNNQYYIKSEARFFYTKKIKHKNIFLVFLIFPRKLKDFIYDVISKNRYFLEIVQHRINSISKP